MRITRLPGSKNKVQVRWVNGRAAVLPLYESEVPDALIEAHQQRVDELGELPSPVPDLPKDYWQYKAMKLAQELAQAQAEDKDTESLAEVLAAQVDYYKGMHVAVRNELEEAQFYIEKLEGQRETLEQELYEAKVGQFTIIERIRGQVGQTEQIVDEILEELE